MAIDHKTTTIPQANVNAAMEALGIPPENFARVYKVIIKPNQIVIHAYPEGKEEGSYTSAVTVFGRAPARTVHTYRIDGPEN